jgi:hypothetical protein
MIHHMHHLFTEPPWSADVADFIYAVNGRVATLQDSAPGRLLAAAPDLLRAVETSMGCLEKEFCKLSMGARRNVVLDARNDAQTAIAYATTGRPASTTRGHLWKVDPTLPTAERRANERLLDAAPDLLEAANKAYAALAGHVDDTEIVEALRTAIVRATH